MRWVGTVASGCLLLGLLTLGAGCGCGCGPKSACITRETRLTADPSAFPDDTDLTGAYAGVTLIADVPSSPPGDWVTNSTPPGEPTRFIMAFSGGGLDSVWTDDPDFVRVFQATFDQLTDFVAVDLRAFLEAPDGTVTGLLEAYDAGGNLIETASAVLDPLTYTTLSLTRPCAEIAWVRVYGSSTTPGAGANISLLRHDI